MVFSEPKSIACTFSYAWQQIFFVYPYVKAETRYKSVLSVLSLSLQQTLTKPVTNTNSEKHFYLKASFDGSALMFTKIQSAPKFPHGQTDKSCSGEL